MSTASSSQQPMSSRARPQARKKANDDAAYFGPPGTNSIAVKRAASDRLEGEPRVKRKRVDPIPGNSHRDMPDIEHGISLVEFNKFTLPTLCRYLASFDLIPNISPSPLRADDPPAPSTLANPPRMMSRAPSPAMAAATPANRPRRDPKDPSRRRSSRLLDEDDAPTRMPIRADIEELHSVVASIAERHFREVSIGIKGKEEVDILAGFMCAVEKHKNARLR